MPEISFRDFSQRSIQLEQQVVTHHEAGQYLTFTVSGERFAVEILEIHEIIELGLMTAVPLAPAYIRGVANLRGKVLPVIDLAVRLGRSAQTCSKRSCIVVIEASQESHQSVGILVEEVNEIIEIPAERVEPPPSYGGQIQPGFMRGMGRVDDRFIILLDMNHVLSREDLGQLAEFTRLAQVGVASESADSSPSAP